MTFSGIVPLEVQASFLGRNLPPSTLQACTQEHVHGVTAFNTVARVTGKLILLLLLCILK